MFGKITSELIQQMVEEFKKDENQEQVKINILDPILCYTLDRLYPYIFITCAIFIIILLITLSILFLIVKSHLGY